MMTNPRGFTLLIAILLATVAVTLGVSLLDIAYKQVVLASTAKQSQFGFYNADSALECALYYDQQVNSFKYTTSPPTTTSMTCNELTVTNFSATRTGVGTNAYVRTDFSVPCPQGGISANVTVYKYNRFTPPSTLIYANGYNTCSADDARRVERGLKVSY